MNYVTFDTAAPKLSVRALMDSEAPELSGGVGGWVVRPRPRRVGLTFWEGRTPFTLNVPVVLDGWRERRYVDLEKSRLERMGLPHPNPGGEPPLVRVSNVPHSDLNWVITDITWGQPIKASGGQLLRIPGVVKLLQYIADDRITLMPAAERRRQEAAKKAQTEKNQRGGGVTPKQKLYVVKVGDTLSSIAARELGNAKRWTEIAKLNNLRDPNNIKVGQTLRLP